MKRLSIRISSLLLASILVLMLSGKAYALEPEQDPAAGSPVEAVSNAADAQPAQQNTPPEQKPSNEQPKTAEQPAAPKQEQPAVLAAANEPQVAVEQAPSAEQSQPPKQSEAVEQAPSAEQSQQPKQSEAAGQARAAEQSQQPKQSEAVEQAPAAEQSQQPKQSEAVEQVPVTEQSQQPKQSEAVEQAPAAEKPQQLEQTITYKQAVTHEPVAAAVSEQKDEQPQQTIQTVTAEPAVPAAQASQVEQTTPDTEIVQVQPEVTPEQPAAPVSAQPVEQAMTGSAVEDIPVLQAVPAAAPVIFSLKAAPLRTALQNTEGGSGEKGGGGENPAAQTEPLLIIGNKQIELDNDASDATDETAATWSYSSTDGSVTLTGYSGADQLIGTAGKDLTIKASGVNRIGSLVVDGNINIVGSGIILVDSIEFPADSSFSFSTNTSVYPDGYGSAAVFLKQGDGTYMLVNGTVTGVIDDSITIPDGVTLVIPNGSQMLLQSVAKIITTTYEQTDEGTWNHISETSYSLEDQNINTVAFSPHTTRSYVDGVVAPELTVPYGSGLIVDTGALMSFNSISTTESHQSSVMHENVYVHQYTPSIALKGLLEVRGRIEKAIIRIAEGAQLEGAENCLNCTINENDNAESSVVSSESVTESPDPSAHQGGGGSVTTTTTVQTGSGSLGQNAGSIMGGTGLSGLLSGHGISTPVTVPVPQTDPTDPPQTDPTDPPQTDPTDPPQTDPTDPPQTDPADPPQTDPTDPPQTDPADPPQTDPTDPPQTDPADPSQTDPVTPPQEETDDPAVTAPADAGEKGTEDTVTVRVEENRIENVFSLIVETSEGTQLRTLETKIAVTMKYSMPAAQRGKKLYVVFRNADGTYEAIKAEYDPETGELTFETDRTGKFVVVGFDFDGTEFSPAFYKALALLDEIKNLK